MQLTLTKKFISVEGIEGVGKSTAVTFIQEYLSKKNQHVVLTREPGGTGIAEQLREILLKPQEEQINSQTELLLMFASRAQHITQVILPALQAGSWVVSDRYIDATYAYQGGGRKMPIDEIAFLDKWVVHPFYPKTTILLDASPEIGMKRAKKRGAQDRIEQEQLEFFERVRAMYLARATKYPERFCIVDAAASLKKVQHRLQAILDQLVQDE